MLLIRNEYLKSFKNYWLLGIIMKTMILPLVMAVLLIPAFSQGMLGSNAVSEARINYSMQGLVNAETGAVTAMNVSQIQSQIRDAVQNRSHARMIIQGMDVETLSGYVNVEAPINNEQKLLMSANMLRLNNEELFNGSSAIMAKINAAIMNKGELTNLSIQSQNGSLTMAQEGGMIVRVRNQEMIMQNNSIYLNISNIAVKLEVMPQDAMVQARVQNNSRADMELIVEGVIPKYQIREEKTVRILGLFPANMNVTSVVNALSQSLESQARPWWSFLAAETE
jgi:hypothetical protein